MHESLFFYVLSCLPILCPCKQVVAVATVEVNKFYISEEKNLFRKVTFFGSFVCNIVAC